MHHGSDYTPYEGIEVTGWPMTMLLRGDVLVRDGKLASQARRGEHIARERSPHASVRVLDQSGRDATFKLTSRQPMAKVTIYTTPFCPYCVMAKRLLTSKAVAFEEIDVSGARARAPHCVEKAGGSSTVPQIWVGDVHVGGCDDLHALERAGELDPLLAS